MFLSLSFLAYQALLLLLREMDYPVKLIVDEPAFSKTDSKKLVLLASILSL